MNIKFLITNNFSTILKTKYHHSWVGYTPCNSIVIIWNSLSKNGQLKLCCCHVANANKAEQLDNNLFGTEKSSTSTKIVKKFNLSKQS